MKELWKLVFICRSYDQKTKWLFLDHCVVSNYSSTKWAKKWTFSTSCAKICSNKACFFIKFQCNTRNTVQGYILDYYYLFYWLNILCMTILDAKLSSDWKLKKRKKSETQGKYRRIFLLNSGLVVDLNIFSNNSHAMIFKQKHSHVTHCSR